MQACVRATARRLLLVVALLGFTAVSFAQASGAGPSATGSEQGAAGRESVVIFGSSSISDSFGRIIEEDVTGLGLRVVRRGLSAAGLARPDFRDIMRELETMPLERARAVVLYFGGNDAQALWLWPAERKQPGNAWMPWNDEDWSATYERRVVNLIEAVCMRGVPKAIVLGPGDVALDGLQRRLDRVRALQREATAHTTCGRFVASSAQSEGQTAELLHASDGIHMTRAGAQRLWDRLRPSVMELLR